MGEPPTNKYVIDRINNDGNYYKENCRWITQKRSARNRRNNRLILYNGKIQCSADWAIELGFQHHVLWLRLYRYDWSIQKTLTTPIRHKKGKDLS